MWHDLSEDDLVHPAQGNEYILKGSELLDRSPPGTRRIASILSCLLIPHFEEETEKNTLIFLYLDLSLSRRYLNYRFYRKLLRNRLNTPIPPQFYVHDIHELRVEEMGM